MGERRKNTKHRHIEELHVGIRHIKSKEGKPLCNSGHPSPLFAANSSEANCNSCQKRKAR